METPGPKNDAPGRRSGAADQNPLDASESPPIDSRKNRVTTADFVATLIREEAEYRREQLASHELLRGPEFRARLRMSPQALNRALKAKRIYALRGPSDEPVYPAFFTTRSPGRTALERVCKALGDLPGGCKHFFLTSRRLSLGAMTPLQALARGKEDEVLALAEAFREE